MAVRCLIVDDNDSFLHAASSMLEEQGIVVAAVASTGADALRKAGAVRPDVMLVDIDLGGESGFDLARRVAGAGDAGRPGVILISAHTEADFTDMIAASPALAFLPKSALSGPAIRGILARAAGGATG